jgi:LDH2 family malate/lactate/ureidoglycolate dehydrogenase
MQLAAPAKEAAMTEPIAFIAADALSAFAASVFAGVGLREADAVVIGRDLVAANLRGIDSHGVSRIPMYLERLVRGVVKAQPDITFQKVAGAVGLVDGDDGMGFLAAHRAMDEAVALAAGSGIGLVGVRRSTHFGMAALYVMQAIEKGYIALAMTNSSPAIPAWGGRTAYLGASPLAAGLPGGEGADYVLDMAMTVIARGKIRLAATHGTPIPLGLALDADGAPTTDAAQAFAGVCLPFGGVKGSALSMLMDLLSGVLTGANYAGRVKSLYFDHSEPQNVGHLFFALRPDLFMPRAEYDRRMDDFVERTKALPKAQGFDEILIPGEPEEREATRRARSGIPLTETIRAQLGAIGERLGVPLPAMIGHPLDQAV